MNLKKTIKKINRPIISTSILLLTIFIYYLIQTPQPLLNKDFTKPVIVDGVIDGIPEYNKLGSRFLVDIKTINNKKHHGKLEVAWYQRHQIVHPGEHWRWHLKLKPVHGLHNPGGFNFERWAKQHDIIATGYVHGKKAQLISTSRFSIDILRAKIQQAIKNHIHSQPLASIINALSIGSKNLLTPETWLVFQRTGTSHLMAVSGLHVGLVVTIAYFIFNYLIRCLPWLLLKMPAQRWAAIGSVIVAWSYGLLVGFSLPTQRAVIMVTVLMLSLLFSRKIAVWQRLLLAFLVILAWQPLAIFSAGFWLSFIAVFWLAYAVFSRHKKFSIHLILILGLLPVTLYYFNQEPLVALLANLIAIPWVTLIIVPLCLLACVLFLVANNAAIGIWWLAAKCFYPLWLLLQYLSHIPVWLHPINSFAVMLSALMAVVLLASPRGLPCRTLGILLLLPLLFATPPHPKKQQVWLTVLDVGQGLATVIQTAQHVLIYDTGPRFPSGFDAGRAVLMPFLKTIGVRKINTLIVSHSDNDHIGGSFWLLKHLAVNQIFSSIPKSRWHRHYQRCFAGQHWQWDGVDFQMLWPPRTAQYADNNSSCVLRVSAGKHALLLTGDIEAPVEKALVANSTPLHADILVAPHHGSRSSSTPAFVNAVQPSVVIMSVGYRNRYHFPAKSVVRRYLAEGARILSTSKRGAIFVALGISSRIRDNGQRIYTIRSFHESTH